MIGILGVLDHGMTTREGSALYIKDEKGLITRVLWYGDPMSLPPEGSQFMAVGRLDEEGRFVAVAVPGISGGVIVAQPVNH